MSEGDKEMPRSGEWEERGSCPAHRTRSLTNARRRQAIVRRSASDSQIPLVESQVEPWREMREREISRPGTSGAQGPGRPRYSTPLHSPSSSTSSLLRALNELEQMAINEIEQDAITEERRKNPPRGAQKRKADDPNPSHMEKKPKGQ